MSNSRFERVTQAKTRADLRRLDKLGLQPAEVLNLIPSHLLLEALAEFSGPIDVVMGCISWSGCIAPNGYGRLSLGSMSFYAHRAALVEARGKIGTDLDACHTCDNRPCINRAHLFPGTRSENANDAKAKLRLMFQTNPEKMPRGERHGMTKLSDDAIRNILASPDKTSDELAAIHNVDRRTVNRVRSGDRSPGGA